MELSAYFLCRNCQRVRRIQYSSRYSLKTHLLEADIKFYPTRLFSGSPVAAQKSFKPDNWKKLTWLQKLAQSTTAGVKISDNVPEPGPIKETIDSPQLDCEEEIEHGFPSPEKPVTEDREERRRLIVTDDGRQLKVATDGKSATAVDTVIAQVTPCPIEAKDGNKEEEKPAVEETWRRQRLKLSELPSLYLQLSKSRLTGLVVISALAGYGMAPATFDPLTFALMAGGTFLTSCSANTINQFFEVPYDSQMARTRNRVLVRGLLSPLHAVGFASAAGITGVTTLYHMVNPLAAGIAAATWLLYTSVYTPLKRVSVVNTWVGALVGALPPMIGWAACTGGLDYGALLMAGFLYCWQFPHFNALSWNLRSDYSRGGYCMMATTDPSLCRRVALRHCIALVGLSTVAPLVGLTTWTFAIDSLPLNLWFGYLGWRFYEDANSKSARRLFLFSLLHLPVLMLLLLISKKDLHPENPRVSFKVVVEEEVVR